TGHPLTELVCNDDDPGNTATGDFTSRIADFAVTAGTTYYIRVSSYAQGRIDGEARLSFSGPALVSNEEAPEIRRLALSPALPNPTVGRTEMTLSVGTPQTLDVGVYDVLGRRVLDVYTGAAAADLSLVIQTTTLRSGTYVVRATGEATAATRTFTVVR
ncbi:MAG: T9SS type A sorting domain-containing protein, partial [Bacteroidota bacterium]